MALVTAAEVRARMAPSETDTRDAELLLCVEAWQGILVPGSSVEATDLVEYVDGSDAGGPCNEVLRFPPGKSRLVWHRTVDEGEPPAPVDHLIEVQEDGSDLEVGIGYSTTADCLIVGANEDRPARLIRGNSAWARAWSCGRQNVKVTYRMGWSATDVPEWVKHLICVGAWKLFTVGPTAGLSSTTDAVGAQTIIEKNLPPLERDMLATLRQSWAL